MLYFIVVAMDSDGEVLLRENISEIGIATIVTIKKKQFYTATYINKITIFK